MKSVGAGESLEKLEGVSTLSRDRKLFVDHIKKDGIQKELYENEWKAQENWERKWNFFKKVWKEEMNKEMTVCNSPKNNKTEKEEQEVNKPLFKELPKLSSGIIGWRSNLAENNLDRLAGPMYVSPRSTMNPPLSLDEPDLRTQRYIFLG